jgi:hypothetical protein
MRWPAPCQPTAYRRSRSQLFERVYAPLTAARLDPVAADTRLPSHKSILLELLYRHLNTALDRLLAAVGLTSSPSINENTNLVDVPITAQYAEPGLEALGFSEPRSHAEFVDHEVRRPRGPCPAVASPTHGRREIRDCGKDVLSKKST